MILVAIYGTLETFIQAQHTMCCRIARDGVFLRARSGNDTKSFAGIFIKKVASGFRDE